MITHFFTIATTNYLPFAVSLLDSVKKHHPEFQLSICLVDYLIPKQISENKLISKYPIIQLHEIGAEEFEFITENYNPMQLANCSKVLFARYLLEVKKAQQVIFGDSDMLFFNRLPNHILKEHSLIFTPHFCSPPPLEMKRQELEVLNAGILNGGFFKLTNSIETYAFLEWLRIRSVKECVYDFKRGIYGEQLWLNFVPLYFKDVLIEKNLGLNVAYWNLHERKITQRDGQFIVNDDTLLSFFHFSGWDFMQPDQISRWALFTSSMRPDIKPILAEYHKALVGNKYEEFIKIPNYYATNNKSKKRSFFQKLVYKLSAKK